MGYRNRNRNSYMKSKAGRAALGELYKGYPELKGNKVFHEFLGRTYGHPDELAAIIRESYPYDDSNTDAFDSYNDAIWNFMEQYGPMTLADSDGSDKVIGGLYLANDMASDAHYNSMRDLLGQMFKEGTGSIAWDVMTDDRDDAYSHMLSSDGEFTDDYWNKLEGLENLFADVGAYGDFVNNSNKTAKQRLGDRLKARWRDLLGDDPDTDDYSSLDFDFDSNGDVKGADGLAGTKDDRGTASKGNSGEPCDNCGGDGTIDEEDEGYASNSDTYDDTDDSGADSGDDAVNDDDDAQSNILNALLQHSL